MSTLLCKVTFCVGIVCTKCYQNSGGRCQHVRDIKGLINKIPVLIVKLILFLLSHAGDIYLFFVYVCLPCWVYSCMCLVTHVCFSHSVMILDSWQGADWEGLFPLWGAWEWAQSHPWSCLLWASECSVLLPHDFCSLSPEADLERRQMRLTPAQNNCKQNLSCLLSAEALGTRGIVIVTVGQTLTVPFISMSCFLCRNQKSQKSFFLSFFFSPESYFIWDPHKLCPLKCEKLKVIHQQFDYVPWCQ